MLRSGVRAADSVCRLGGEEFGIILPRTPLMTAAKLAQRLCAKLNTTVPYGEHQIPITASFGVSGWSKGMVAQDLLSQADAAMYQAKNSGRNRVVVDAQDKRVLSR